MLSWDVRARRAPGKPLIADALVTRLMRAVLAAVVLLVLVAPGVQAKAPEGFAKVAHGPFMAGASAAHGDVLAWASPLPNGDVELRLTNVTTAKTTTLGTIVGPPGGFEVGGLAFDGTWVAWIDDRLGAPDAFAQAVDGSALRRLSRDGLPKTALSVAEGRASWLVDATVWVADLEADVAAPLPGNAHDFSACLQQDHVLVSRYRSAAGNVSVALVALDGTETGDLLSSAAGQHELHCDGGAAAWMTVDGGLRTVRYAAAGQVADVLFLGRGHGAVVGVAEGLVALEGDKDGHGFVELRSAEGGALAHVPDARFAGLSSHGLVVAVQGSDGWTFYAQSAGPAGHSSPVAPMGLGVLALAFAARRFRGA